MKDIWFFRRGDTLTAADEDAQKFIQRMGDNECKAFRPASIRCPVEHRRYWAMMTLVAKNVRRIEIDRIGREPIYMRILSKENAHNAMKLCTGLYETCPVGSTDFAVRVPNPTNFEEMTSEEWARYWPQVMEVLLEKAVPEVQIPEVQADMLRCLERWQAEAA
jgi:hypothetical protein